MEHNYQLRLRINIKWMCDYLGVSRSGYYTYRHTKMSKGQTQRNLQDINDFALVKTVYDYKGYPKGSRMIAMMMPRIIGIIMNRKKIQRLMDKYALYCPIRRANPLKRIMKAMRTNSIFTNKLNRQFNIQRPGYHLLTDITYIFYGSTAKKRCYLSALKDASTNEIVAWSISELCDIEFVLHMLKMLDTISWLPSSIVIHSDQGCHYTSIDYRMWLKANDISQSMSRKGNCWDNAPIESFFGHAKDELRLTSCESFDEVVTEINNYIDYYNNDRPQAALGKVTPRELRESLLIQPSTLLMVVEQIKSSHLMTTAY